MKEKPEKIKDFLGHENSSNVSEFDELTRMSLNFRWKELEISVLDLNTMEDFEDK